MTNIQWRKAGNMKDVTILKNQTTHFGSRKRIRILSLVVKVAAAATKTAPATLNTEKIQKKFFSIGNKNGIFLLVAAARPAPPAQQNLKKKEKIGKKFFSKKKIWWWPKQWWWRPPLL